MIEQVHMLEWPRQIQTYMDALHPLTELCPLESIKHWLTCCGEQLEARHCLIHNNKMTRLSLFMVVSTSIHVTSVNPGFFLLGHITMVTYAANSFEISRYESACWPIRAPENATIPGRSLVGGPDISPKSRVSVTSLWRKNRFSDLSFLLFPVGSKQLSTTVNMWPWNRIVCTR